MVSDWQTVQRRGYRDHVSRWDVYPAIRRKIGREEISSVFFSEIPETTSAEDVFALFGCIGDIVEVVISPRRNKYGKRFGFARFMEVEDLKRLAIKLDNVMIEGKKIHANPPRFERGGGKEVFRNLGGDRKQAHVHQKQGQHRREGECKGGIGGKSFAEVVANKESCQVPWLKFSTKEECLLRFKKAYIGEVHHFGSTYNMQSSFEMEGYFQIKVSPLGPNLCLLEEVEEGEIEDLINEGSCWWKQWFSTIRPWKESDVDRERALWIRIFGIPCQAMCFEFYEKLGNTLGSYICYDVSSVNMMEVVRIMVRVPLSFRLQEQLKVDVDGNSYSLHMKEDSQGMFRSEARHPKQVISSVMSSSSDEGWLEGEDSTGNEVLEDSLDDASQAGEPAEEGGNVNFLHPIDSTNFLDNNNDFIEKCDGTFDKAIINSKLVPSPSSSGVRNVDPSSTFIGTKETTVACTVACLSVPTNTLSSAHQMKRRRRNKCLKFKKVVELVGTTHSKKAKIKKNRFNFGSLTAYPEGKKEGPQEVFLNKPVSLSNSAQGGDVVGSHCYGSQSEESNIMRCNSRIQDNLDLNIGDKLWKAISNLGVVVEDTKKDYKKKIVEMELKDRVRKKGGKAPIKLLQ